MTSTHKIPDRLLSFALLSGDIHFVIPTHAYRYNQHLYCSCINTIDDSRGPVPNRLHPESRPESGFPILSGSPFWMRFVITFNAASASTRPRAAQSACASG